MQDKAERQFESRLDHRQYDESQLISLKVPVTRLSYYNNSTSFERADGQLEINGVPYQYVKRRIYDDTLELLCIPNQTAMKLRLSRDEYFKLVNDIQRSQQGQHPGSHSGASKSFIGDPYTLANAFTLEDRSFTLIVRSYYFPVRIHSIPRSTEERPPIALS
jgi:hypothetical protein